MFVEACGKFRIGPTPRHSSIVEKNHRMTSGCFVQMVGTGKHGHTSGRFFLHHIPGVTASGRIESGRGFVKEENGGLVEEGARHGDTLTPTVRQRARAVPATICKPESG
jgi:hypothetical protein